MHVTDFYVPEKISKRSDIKIFVLSYLKIQTKNLTSLLNRLVQ